jgi:outer membrane protein TolC
MHLEERPHDPISPTIGDIQFDPATVLDLKRESRPISLKEAIAIAIEQGNVGGLGGTGQDNTQLPQFTGRGTSGSDTIKAFVLDPAIVQADIERSLSKFDARWITSMTWNKQDQATLTLQQSFSNGDQAAFQSTLAKPLPTGGVSGITVSMNYLNLSNPPPAGSGFVALNTSYTPRVQFIFEQPLLQGFGIEANQLLPNHPGSTLIQGFRSTGAGTEGILVSRIRSEQAREQFNLSINQMLLNVEVAYWNLYSAYYNLYGQEEGYKAAFLALNYVKPRVEGGIEDPPLLPQLEGNLWTFYDGVIQARGQVLEADRALRGLMGLRSDDGTIFVPSDEPLRTPFTINFREAYNEGLKNRPEVIIARQELKARQLDLRAQKLGRMPDLRFFSSYDVNGLGGRFFGPDNNAFSSLATNQFNSWQVGIRLDMPLGFRDANALVRQAQWNLWRTYYTLSDAERKVFEILVQSRRQMDQAYAQIETQSKIRKANEEQSKLLFEKIDQLTGGAAYVQVTQAQQNLARAIAAEFQAVADYNSALARIEFAKGSIQRYNNITVADGPLPAFVSERAADHYRARQAGLKLREHPVNATQTGSIAGYQMAPLSQLDQQVLQSMPSQQLPPALPAPQSNPSTPNIVLPQSIQPEGAPAAGGLSMSKPAPVTVQPWDNWKGSGDSKLSVPAVLPSFQSETGQAGQFTAEGTVSLPRRTPLGVEPPAMEPGIPVTTTQPK